VEQTSVSLLQRLLTEPDKDKAWEQMFHLYGPWLERWLRHWEPTLGTDVDDLVQEIMTVVIRGLPSFHRQGAGKFRAWLKKIAVNSLREHQRARRRQPQALPHLDGSDVLAQVEDPTSELSRQWDQEHDRYLIKRLLKHIEAEFNATDWQAFHRLMFDGIEPVAVAAELNVSVNVVYLARSRILNRLRAEGRDFLD
jgi:RNA polymerase sigma factor (sigma-70 family)